MQALLTVCWSNTVSIDLPAGITPKELMNANWNSRPEVQEVALRATQQAYGGIRMKDGEITAVDEDFDDSASQP